MTVTPAVPHVAFSRQRLLSSTSEALVGCTPTRTVSLFAKSMRGTSQTPLKGGSAAYGSAQMLIRGATVWRALEAGVESQLDGPDMSAIVESYRYRLFVRGMRLALLFPVTVLLLLLVRLGVAESVLVPLVLLLAMAMVLGIMVGWIGAVLLVRDTSHYSGAARGKVDIRKVWALIRRAASDISDLRRW